MVGAERHMRFDIRLRSILQLHARSVLPLDDLNRSLGLSSHPRLESDKVVQGQGRPAAHDNNDDRRARTRRCAVLLVGDERGWQDLSDDGRSVDGRERSRAGRLD